MQNKISISLDYEFPPIYYILACNNGEDPKECQTSLLAVTTKARSHSVSEFYRNDTGAASYIITNHNHN